MKRANGKRRLSLTARRSLHGYLFILPFVLGFFFMILSPFILYFVMAFNKITAGSADGGAGLTMTPVGWDNFAGVFFNDQTFVQTMADSLKNLLFAGVCIMIFSFFIAILLNQKFHGRALARALFFLPVVVASGSAALSQEDALSTSAIAVITNMSSITGYSDGFSLPMMLMRLLGNSGEVLLDIIMPLIKQFYTIAMSSGVQILIFLAGLQSISPSLYEAAYMDGATPWESFWKITFPMMTPMILVNAVYTVVDFMSSPNNDVINMMYQYSIVKSEYGMSSAMGSVYFGILFLLLGLLFAVISRFVVYNDK